MSENTLSSQSSHLDDVQLNEYLDGYLPENQIVILEKHLDTCLHCAARLNDLKAVFSSLESLPDASLERDLSIAVVSTVLPAWKLPPRWKWGALIQFVFAFIVILLAVPSLYKTWLPLIHEVGLTFSGHLSVGWMMLFSEWSTQLTEVQRSWAILISGWQPPSIMETTKIVVWPIFVVAILLFVVGNGLLLRKVMRNNYH